MRFFLDANILFSAAKSGGAIRQLVEAIHARGHESVADEYVIAETRRNLELKFPAALLDFEKLLRGVTRVLSLPVFQAPSFALLLTEKDRPVFTAAIQHRCHVLLAGDKTHFGQLYGQTIAGVSICSPQGLAEILANEKERPKRSNDKTRR